MVRTEVEGVVQGQALEQVLEQVREAPPEVEDTQAEVKEREVAEAEGVSQEVLEVPEEVFRWHGAAERVPPSNPGVGDLAREVELALVVRLVAKALVGQLYLPPTALHISLPAWSLSVMTNS